MTTKDRRFNAHDGDTVCASCGKLFFHGAIDCGDCMSKAVPPEILTKGCHNCGHEVCRKGMLNAIKKCWDQEHKREDVPGQPAKLPEGSIPPWGEGAMVLMLGKETTNHFHKCRGVHVRNDECDDSPACEFVGFREKPAGEPVPFKY
jgi:hypothetical protein